jgi:hypothetical protein
VFCGKTPKVFGAKIPCKTPKVFCKVFILVLWTKIGQIILCDRTGLALSNCLLATQAVQKNLPEIYYRKKFLCDLNELETFNITPDKSAKHNQWYDLVLQD